MRLLFLFLIAFPTLLSAQMSIEQELDSISDYNDAKAFIKVNKSVKGKLVTFNKEKHKTKLANELFGLAIGGKKTYKTERNKTHYKVLDKSQSPHYRVSIIRFDSKKELSQINAQRNLIIKAYKTGEHQFETLAKTYSIDRSGKTGGDLGWIKKGERSDNFETVIDRHNVGDIFILDDKNIHYVVLKTKAELLIDEITLLKVTEPIK
ncbi:peptidyl-prolyl cis-trans isomerase [Winogradskyella immobilis]|uniref:Peptidylprolyl isomerase n=1 Tax=Winogradskyella immobilis TaxID=2816852 RepID=A0ABS8EMV7_9FLAO|nr:peptidyl-prolyl cis-trans isomerase [Winogradskyella immobilis]MCC1484192.1 peptidylprolyl isomerase [Winogradskyella immobilis]MCG0016284.1 peptidyl-prolyl cis-trans isomerase [Winogradskyella immobilis]